MNDDLDSARIDDPLSRRLVIGLIVGGVICTLSLSYVLNVLLRAGAAA